MKKLTPLLCLAMAASLLIACNNNQPVPASAGASIRLDSTDNSIFRSWALAKQDIHCYDSLCHVLHLPDTPIRFYTVRAQDLFAALGMDSAILTNPLAFKFKYIRVTLGFELDNKQFRLYIQPVTGANLNAADSLRMAGKPLFFRKDGSIDSTSNPDAKPGDDASIYVADLNAPCPNTCGN